MLDRPDVIADAAAALDIPHKRKAFYPELESLRGVAAMCVVILHVIVVTVGQQNGGSFGPKTLEQLGLPAFLFVQLGVVIFNGRMAVILFFVLSGFVMSASFDNAEHLDTSTYIGFLIRRFFRLMPTIWAAVAFAVIINGAFLPHTLPFVTDYLTLRNLSFDPVAWTLVLEIAMCLIYPFMAFATARLGTGPQLLILGVLLWYTGEMPEFWYADLHHELPLLAFYLGLVVPTLGRQMIGLLGRAASVLVPVVLLALAAPELTRWYGDFHPDFGLQAGNLELYAPLPCFYLISWLIYGRQRSVTNALMHPIPRAIGRWSYGIYLFHLPLLGGPVLGHLGGITPLKFRLVLAFAITVPLTLLSAGLNHRLIEQPCIRLGRRVSAAIAALSSPHRRGTASPAPHT